MTPEVGCIVANRFELVRELGRGSMGTVWLANHLTLDVPCAVKFMTGEATRDPSYAARFELEARAIAKLSSPNVVRVLDYDMHEGMPFIAMECLKGEDLGARLQRVGRLDAATTHRIIAQVAHGLAKAHAAGVIHRDLKPDNIFLAEDDDGEVAKIVDFGIAKLTGFASADGLSSSTQAGSLIGTPAYMSPEQARGVSDLDHRSDLWSLAIIAFECLTGKLPFDSTSLGDLFAKILFEPMPIPSHVAPESSSPNLDRWWARAASRPVADRYGSALELADGLGRALGLIDDVVEIRDTLRARDWDVAASASLRPVTHSTRTPLPPPPRSRSSKVLVLAMALAFAPLALMITSGRIDARSSVRPVASAAAGTTRPPEAAMTLPPAAGLTPVAQPDASAMADYKLTAGEAQAKAAAAHAIAPAALQPVRVPSRAHEPTTTPTAEDDFGI